MNKKNLLIVSVSFAVLVVAVLFAMDTAAAKKPMRVDSPKHLCEFANPPQGCTWNIKKGYPKCEAELVCDGTQL